MRSIIDKVWKAKSIIRDTKYYEDLIPLKTFSGKGIPKVIHQVYMQGWEYVPHEILDNIAEMKALNPTWSYKAWDETMICEYIREHYGLDILHYYERISPRYPSVRGDFFKYLLMYNEGGLYLDHKSRVSKPLDERYSDEYSFVVSYWDKTSDNDAPKTSPDEPRGCLMLWFMFAAPGHSLLRDLLIQSLMNIDGYTPISIGVGKEGAFNLAGPGMYTDVVLANRELVNFVYWIEEWGGVFSLGEGDHGHHNLKGYIAYKQNTEPIIAAKHPIVSLLYKVYLFLSKLKQILKTFI